MDSLSAIHMLTHTWEQVKVSTVQKCFPHTGFTRREAGPDKEEDTADSGVKSGD